MTLMDWRKNGENLAVAASMLEQPAMQQMLSVLDSDNPANNPKPIRDGASAMYEIGLIYGYRLALDSLRSMREPIPSKPEEIQTKWGVTEE